MKIVIKKKKKSNELNIKTKYENINEIFGALITTAYGVHKRNGIDKSQEKFIECVKDIIEQIDEANK